MEKLSAETLASSGVAKNSDSTEQTMVTGVFTATCYDKDGNLKWTDTYKNLVTNVGKADLLDKYLAGSTYTAAWYLGLVDGGTTPTYNASDTLASHSGWTEIATGTGYTAAGSSTNRATPTWNAATGTGGGAGTAGTGSKATNAAAFAITATLTIAGTLLCSTLARGTASNGGAGILYSAGSFTGGNKSVASGDTLNVTYTAQV